CTGLRSRIPISSSGLTSGRLVRSNGCGWGLIRESSPISRKPSAPVSKFPEPPDSDVLVKTPPAWHDLLPGTEQWRIYFRGGGHPTEWNPFRAYGPANGRFDHHRPPPREPERRIYCAAASPITCLAEVFQDARNVDVHRRDPWLVGFALRRMVRLLDLRGE